MKTHSQNDVINNLKWIADNWIYSDDSKNLVIYESWEKTEKGYKGYSKKVKDGKTVFEEFLSVEKEDGEIFYIADVSHNPKPVKFRLTCNDLNEVVFENPEHDFPKKIRYKLIDDKELDVLIQGEVNGTIRTVNYLMSRIK
ncbi:MAG: DUF6265 family protein [Ignavibacteria bacterium]|nr:DUF6265 family protein [Ignavibacteria bacterium]